MNADVMKDTGFFLEINESKSLLLLDILPIYAGIVQMTCILKMSNGCVEKNVVARVGTRKIALKQKWKHGIK